MILEEGKLNHTFDVHFYITNIQKKKKYPKLLYAE